MKDDEGKSLWIVVSVFHGIPDEAWAFTSRKEAKRKARDLEGEANPDYDEVGFFGVPDPRTGQGQRRRSCRT